MNQPSQSKSWIFSLQACILKELEDKWGETYLSTFPDTGSAAASKQNVHSDTFFNEVGFKSNHFWELNFPLKVSARKIFYLWNLLKRLFSGKMGHAWKKFYEFIRRTAKFFKCMKNREIRMQFEKYLETIGKTHKTLYSYIG